MATKLTPVGIAKLFISRSGVKRVDALSDLKANDPMIARDAKILISLKDRARGTIKSPAARVHAKNQPSLYKRYRGPGYPLTTAGKPVPEWRFLSSWMKVQVATLVLNERGYIQFTIKLNDELRADLERRGADQKAYLRDRMARCLRPIFGRVPHFVFIMEEQTKSGLSMTRPHAHGSIEAPRRALPTRKIGDHGLNMRILVRRFGLVKAEYEYGRLSLIEALHQASGNGKGSAKIVNGINQARNIWTRRPYHKLFNSQWMDYSFKNEKRVSRRLGNQRLAFSRDLNKEAQRLWKLISIGEEAMDQWET